MSLYIKGFRAFALGFSLLICLSACNFAILGENETQNDILSKEEAISHYKQASYAYGWFEIYNIDYDKNDKVQIEGGEYYKVVHEEIHDILTLREFLGQYFTDNVIDRLLNGEKTSKKFKELDTKLYTNTAVRAVDAYAGEESFRIVSSQNKDIVNLLVDVEQLNSDLEVVSTKEYTFLLKNIGGKWLFDDFTLVR